MNQYLASLIDCYFWSEDSGIVVGGSHTADSLSSGLIFFTSDGGTTWVERHRTDSLGELCWKISFPSKNVGYVSVQKLSTGSRLLKTTDQGVTWTSVWLPNYTRGFIQGVGFLNDSVGWTGGWWDRFLFTRNGGKSWTNSYYGADVGNIANRFRFFGDSLGYCSGRGIYKLVIKNPGDVLANPNTPFTSVNYPNPFERSTTIHISLLQNEYVTLKVYNTLGQELTTLLDRYMLAGEHDIPFDASLTGHSSYFYILRAGGSEIRRQMIHH